MLYSENEFSTKARTLEKLQGRLRSAKIVPLYIFKVERWATDKPDILQAIADQFGDKRLIVRSSTLQEDQKKFSGAGKYESILNVDEDSLEDAINQVIGSYGNEVLDSEVLVQPMLKDAIISGVAFSHDPNTCAPYRIINYSKGPDTTIVTNGDGGEVLQIAAGAATSKVPMFKNIIDLIDELLAVSKDEPVDIEFAITKNSTDETLWLLQVRPLILPTRPESDERQNIRLKNVENRLRKAMRPNPFLLGETTVFGVMPDWNPAEIIGVRPKPLALSLYRELFTDSIWAYQRHNYGYRNLRSHRLMPNFFGLPYIDVRVSFNSFIPELLDDSIGSRLVDYYIDKLVKKPNLHDKIEFEIVWSCFTFDLKERLKVLPEEQFSSDDREQIADSLRQLTNSILNPTRAIWRQDASKLKTLSDRRAILHATEMSKPDRVYWLIEDMKRYGTLPFAGLARAGFMSVQILKSLVDIEIFSRADYDRFMASLHTVSSQMVADRFKLSKSEFLQIYGHLRPGTYDILSARYDESPELYFDWSKPMSEPVSRGSFSLSNNQFDSIAKLLRENKLETNPTELLEFLKSAIELREYSKFEFSHNLSDAMLLIKKIGLENNIPVEEVSYCDIRTFQELHISACDAGLLLKQSVEKGVKGYAEASKLALPPVITNPNDVNIFHWPESEPNFITQKQVIARVADVANSEELENVIVCIPSADPGFDWLFSHSIAGLITAWGGANSHMAIRAGEQGLPAVIGAGSLLYDRWSKAECLHIDCAGRKVSVIT